MPCFTLINNADDCLLYYKNFIFLKQPLIGPRNKKIMTNL